MATRNYGFIANLDSAFSQPSLNHSGRKNRRGQNVPAELISDLSCEGVEEQRTISSGFIMGFTLNQTEVLTRSE